ncbi:MAG: DUF6340 family protein [Tannerella sp.]|nr:DUF6340 family protein [Tannerella sp.]
MTVRAAERKAEDTVEKAGVSFPLRLTSGLFGLLFVAGCLWAVSCSPVRYVGIETHTPASITFPRDVKKVLILNRAAAQPEVPFTSTIRKPSDTLKIASDSALADFCRILGRQIAESPYFEDVLLYEGLYRTDQAVASDVKLTGSEVRQLCREHDVQAVISLDRLLFSIREEVWKISVIDELNEWHVAVSGILRTYWPDGDTVPNAIYLTDTVIPRLTSDDGWADVSVLTPEQVLREVAAYLATEAYVHFVPYWREDTRWYYVSSDSRWKEAAAFAATERWESAVAIWEALYEKSVSWKAKARLASNLALGAELGGQLTAAWQWATLAYQYFAEHLDANHSTVLLQKSYVEVLEQRIAAEKILHRQLE